MLFLSLRHAAGGIKGCFPNMAALHGDQVRGRQDFGCGGGWLVDCQESHFQMWQFHIRHFDSLSCLVIILLFPFQLRERTFPSRFSRAVANNLFIGMFTLSSGEKNHALKCDGAFEILSILSNNLKIMGKWP